MSGWTIALIIFGLLMLAGAGVVLARRRHDELNDPKLGDLDHPVEQTWEEREIEAMLADGSSPAGSPRAQHYDFAHLLLRRRFFEDPSGLARLVAGEDGETFLQAMWNEAMASGEVDPIPPRGLKGTLVGGARGVLVVVDLPRPRAMTEAHQVALVVPEQGDPRYFTLELGFDEDDHQRTVLCEWRDGAHMNFGDGPAPDIEAFAAAVRAKVEPESAN
ncbi:MAG: hypothetical protein CSA65_04085 [Proteobacteria bacterium]|nr:MAG: hypothetical protein CSA65_04085 [Pseudomonadota bacterium]